MKLSDSSEKNKKIIKMTNAHKRNTGLDTI